MATFTSLVDGDESLEAYWLTMLANELADDIPRLCKLRTFYDGAETVPVATVPKNVDVTASAVYQRFVAICPADFARIIADSVSSRQKPIGFRLVSDKAQRSTEADMAWKKNSMDVKTRQVMHDVAVYGSGYFLVSPIPFPERVRALSPWEARVSANGEYAIMYSFNEFNEQETIGLTWIERAEDGSIAHVWERKAVRDANHASILLESQKDDIYKVYNQQSATKTFSFPTDFKWKSAAEEIGWAAECGHIPLVRIGSGSGMGQFEPHLPLLSAIDQQRFQRFCIQEMQAFRQRAITGPLQTRYKPDDPPVLQGLAKAGDMIDYSQAFTMGPAALWMLPNDTSIWESQVTDVTQLVTAAASDIKHLAAASGTPLDILSPDVAGSASGADLKREGLIFKVEDLNARANEAFVQILRLAMAADDTPIDVDEMFETVWAPIAPDSDLNMAQAAGFVKEFLAPKTIMRRFLHMTETEISEAMQDMADSTYQNALTTATAATDAAKQASEDSSGGFARVDDSDDGVKALVDVGGEANG